MTRHDDGGVRTVVSGIYTRYMPRIIFDWHDGLIIFTNVGSHDLLTEFDTHMTTLRLSSVMSRVQACDIDLACHSSFQICWIVTVLSS